MVIRELGYETQIKMRNKDDSRKIANTLVRLEDEEIIV
jgi:hypothetical protein